MTGQSLVGQFNKQKPHKCDRTATTYLGRASVGTSVTVCPRWHNQGPTLVLRNLLNAFSQTTHRNHVLPNFWLACCDLSCSKRKTNWAQGIKGHPESVSFQRPGGAGAAEAPTGKTCDFESRGHVTCILDWTRQLFKVFRVKKWQEFELVTRDLQQNALLLFARCWIHQ